MAKKKSFPASLAVLIGGIALMGILVLFPPGREEVNPELLPWNSYYDEQNQLHALGLVLENSTVQDAIAIFGNDYEVKLFSKKDESGKTAEVYFPTANIGTIRGGIALSVNVPPSELETIYENGVQTTVTKLGNRQVTPAAADGEKLLQHTIRHATLVPKKDLTERAIKMRFGEPSRSERQSDGVDHWFYPEKGLEILFNPEGPEGLQYYPGAK